MSACRKTPARSAEAARSSPAPRARTGGESSRSPFATVRVSVPDPQVRTISLGRERGVYFSAGPPPGACARVPKSLAS